MATSAESKNTKGLKTQKSDGPVGLALERSLAALARLIRTATSGQQSWDAPRLGFPRKVHTEKAPRKAQTYPGKQSGSAPCRSGHLLSGQLLSGLACVGDRAYGHFHLHLFTQYMALYMYDVSLLLRSKPQQASSLKHSGIFQPGVGDPIYFVVWQDLGVV